MARVWQSLADQQQRSIRNVMPQPQRNPTDGHVGNRVRTRRVALGLSQSALGDAIGVTFQQIQKYERGNNRISASRLHGLADVLQVTPEFFFEGLEQVQAQSSLDPATELSSHADALALMGAFRRIKSRKLQRSVISLIEELAAGERDQME